MAPHQGKAGGGMEGGTALFETAHIVGTEIFSTSPESSGRYVCEGATTRYIVHNVSKYYVWLSGTCEDLGTNLSIAS